MGRLLKSSGLKGRIVAKIAIGVGSFERLGPCDHRARSLTGCAESCAQCSFGSNLLSYRGQDPNASSCRVAGPWVSRVCLWAVSPQQDALAGLRSLQVLLTMPDILGGVHDHLAAEEFTERLKVGPAGFWQEL